jgi:hypothetical protein
MLITAVTLPAAGRQTTEAQSPAGTKRRFASPPDTVRTADTPRTRAARTAPAPARSTPMTPPARRLGRGHGLHLTVIRAQPFERADAHDHVALPRGSEGHIGRPEPGEVERVRAPWRGLRPRAGRMGVQQVDDARVVQAAFDDVHGDLLQGRDHCRRMPTGERTVQGGIGVPSGSAWPIHPAALQCELRNRPSHCSGGPHPSSVDDASFGSYATHTPGTATFWNRCGEATADGG